jgi:hypothetical protein
MQNDNGRLLCGNSASAVRMGHISSSQLISFYSAAHAAMLAGPRGVTVEAFENAMSDLRFAPYEHGVRRMALDAGLGLPELNTPDVNEQTLYHVLKLRYLHYLIDSDCALANDLSLPVGNDPRDPDVFLEDWNAIPEDERCFSLSGGLGNPIVWFTNEVGAQAARAYSTATGLPLADAFCEVLGLGHHEQND